MLSMFRLVIAAYVDSRSESSGVGYAGAVAVGTGAQPVLVVVCFRMYVASLLFLFDLCIDYMVRKLLVADGPHIPRPTKLRQ